MIIHQETNITLMKFPKMDSGTVKYQSKLLENLQSKVNPKPYRLLIGKLNTFSTKNNIAIACC